MKKLMMILLLIFIPILAFAQAPTMTGVMVDPTFAPPEWLAGILMFIKSIPTVGPILVVILKYAGVLASFLTAVSAFLIAVKKAFESLSQITWLSKLSDAAAFIDKIIPWAAYLSMFNVPQKPTAQAIEVKEPPKAG